MTKETRRRSSNWYENDEERPYVEDFTPEWALSVMDGLEYANWHSVMDAFEPLIALLPKLYKSVDKPLQKELRKAIRAWDNHF